MYSLEAQEVLQVGLQSKWTVDFLFLLQSAIKKIHVEIFKTFVTKLYC
jgi:hypothetical protein